MEKGKTMAELKAICPNCGSNLTSLWQTTHGYDIKTYFRRCDWCHWCGASRLTIRGANRAWNRGVENGKRKAAD